MIIIVSSLLFFAFGAFLSLFVRIDKAKRDINKRYRTISNDNIYKEVSAILRYSVLTITDMKQNLLLHIDACGGSKHEPSPRDIAILKDMHACIHKYQVYLEDTINSLTEYNTDDKSIKHHSEAFLRFKDEAYAIDAKIDRLLELLDERAANNNIILNTTSEEEEKK